MKLFEITTGEISIDEVAARLADPANGAIVTFVGVVRGETDGREDLHDIGGARFASGRQP